MDKENEKGVEKNTPRVKGRFEKYMDYAFKSIATAGFPPIGGLLWSKKKPYKALGFFGGLAFSILFSIGLNQLTSSKICKNPDINIKKYRTYSLSEKVVAASSPFSFYSFFKRPITELVKDGSVFWIKGENVVRFENNEYVLDFPPTRPFITSSGDKSVRYFLDKAEDYRLALIRSLERGEIFAARKARKSLGSTLCNLGKRREAYEAVRGHFQEAVNEMNRELGGLEKSASKERMGAYVD